MQHKMTFLFKGLGLTLFLAIGMTFHLSAQKNNAVKAYRELTSPEKCWVIFHPFSAKKAYNISVEVQTLCKDYEQEGVLDGDLSGGRLDAFKHAYWMARLTLELNHRKARSLGKAHEKGNYKTFKKAKRKRNQTTHDRTSMEMDMWNNEVGIEIGKAFPDANNDELIRVIMTAILDGRMKIIRKGPQGGFLDQEGNLIDPSKLQGKWENEKMLVPSNEKPN